MNKAAYVIGFSISPTHVSAVKLSLKDFSVLVQERRALPPATIAHDGKAILEPAGLIIQLQELMEVLDKPQFDDPVYVAISPSVFGTCQLNLPDKRPLREELLSRILTPEEVMNDVSLLQSAILSQHAQSAVVSYALADRELINQYYDVFYQVGLRIKAIDLISLCSLRALAATGVFDALLKKIGHKASWCCFGVTASQTWYAIWSGASLMRIGTFATPTQQSDWEAKLLEQFDLAETGTEKPAIWLAWQERGTHSSIDPLGLNLNAPVRPAVLGPIYGKPPYQPPMAALGAALKIDIPFPLGWDFLADPVSEPIKAEHAVIPYHNYQPVLPKILFRVALVLFLVVFLGYLYIGFENKKIVERFDIQNASIEERLSTLSQDNHLYFTLFSWINERTTANIQIERLKIVSPEKMYINGRAFQQTMVRDFITAITTPTAQSKSYLVTEKLSITPDKTTTPAGFRFEFVAHITSSPPKRGGSV